jgi:DnaJ-class molecular chaperone
MTLYDDLNVHQGASADEIKKAYHKLAMKHHPDKGGNSELFKKISHSYDVLSDPQKRQMYDQTGSENGGGGPQHGGMPFDMGDMFMNMFGNRGRHPKRNDFEHVIGVTLEDVYRGTKKNLRIEVKRTCFSCIGSCRPCNGAGVHHVNMGFMNMEQPCGHCDGIGSVSTGCPQCQFQKTTTEIKEVAVNIECGVQNDSMIIVNGLGEQARKPEDIPGNLILRIVVKKHAHFKREGRDLVYKQKITFIDSVNGTIISIPHFEGDLKVSTQDFGVLDPRERYKVDGKGLVGGDLYVIFDVQYPDKDVRYVLSTD